jgi:hypothetical protein
MDRIRWGMLSTARIGRVVARACRDSRSAEFVAVASRDGARARQFADEEGVTLSFGGTRGRIVVRDPWLCRAPSVELWREGDMELVAVDPEGAFALAHDDSDAYRIERDTISAAILAGDQTAYGRVDAVEQARVLDAIRGSARLREV